MSPLLLLMAAPLSLSVMSFNIRYGTADDGADRWELRREMAIGVIRDGNPDILGVQEALRFQLDEIGQSVPGYGEIGVGRDDGVTAGEYSAILYRKDRFDLDKSGQFWFSDTPEKPSRHWGNTNIRMCTFARLVSKETGHGFWVYNLHIDHESQPSREKSALLLTQRIREQAKDEPVIVMGDFNVPERNPVIRYLVGAAAHPFATPKPCPPSPALVDTFALLNPRLLQQATYHGFHGGIEGNRIDYIFVSPKVRVLEAGIVRTSAGGRFPSDHFPVTARIELRPR